MSSSFGKCLKISIFGESHGDCIGAVIDGFPSGVQIDNDFILKEMKRRAPGGTLATKRIEEDKVKIVSGVYNGYSTGAPICGVIENTDLISKDYEKFRSVPRPSHADFTSDVRYQGFNDMRGSGHFSGRLTAPIVFAGAICKIYLSSIGIEIGAHFRSLGKVSEVSFIDLNKDEINHNGRIANSFLNHELLQDLKSKDLAFIMQDNINKAEVEIHNARNQADSIGGVVECAVIGLPAGFGSPMMEGIESKIASIMFSIPGVKGLEFGAGFELTKMLGSEANDCFCLENDVIATKTSNKGGITTKTNNNGGGLGGISTGAPIVFSVAFKPTPSIGKKQNTLNATTGELEELSIAGRHDPCIAVRGLPVIEAAAAISILDIVMEGQGYAKR